MFVITLLFFLSASIDNFQKIKIITIIWANSVHQFDNVNEFIFM